ncbi:MAG: amidohydrolase family protein [Firmicutes bacterium]|nr:amidohydrolase family protein [Bacillota bacterium]
MISDKIIYNGRIHTENPNLPEAEAIVIEGKNIIFVGSNEEALKRKGSNTEMIDLGGKTVLPGIIDGHSHPSNVSKTYWHVFGKMVKDKDELLANIKAAAEANPKETTPFFYYEGYYAETFGAEGPNHKDLDEILPDRPARIQEFSDHACWYNKVALDMMRDKNGVPQANSPIGKPEFIKDQDGDYTGYCLENSCDDPEIYEAVGWHPDVKATEQSVGPLLDFMKQHGVMCIMDGFTDGEEDMKFFYEYDKAGKLGLFYDATSILSDVADLDECIATLRHWQENYSSDHIRCNTVKFFLDGNNEMGDMLSVEPFRNDPSGEYYGQSYATLEEMIEVIVRLNEEKIDFHVHCVCDGSVRRMCDAVEKAQELCGDSWCIRVTLTHCLLIHPDDRKRFAELGIYIDYTPHWSGGYLGIASKEFLGEERVNSMYDFREVIESGGMVGFSSDIYSYGEANRGNPFMGMQIGMTRVDPEFPVDPKSYPDSEYPPAHAKLTLEELIHGYTINNAIRMRVDDIMGSIEKGKLANLIVMDEDPFTTPPEKFRHIKIDRTFFEGVKRQITSTIEE